ncbi:amidohydrolase family protein [uncultured Ilumatobacter sp.]|jgi:aminocarboxymuconate-semialdehyde decarboxylase|uniref:amidohydrolase family protein n=1 Tax=uncultured Ilumatobacter sp. TaxID=879968 RepID=UPI00374FA719|tara:strand:- start:201 stop:1214 length:1014 start_codon:yes stop_codon:yes gene_type:complete
MTQNAQSPTIDMHCHLATPAAAALTDPHARPEYEPYNYFMGNDSIEQNKVMFPTIVDSLQHADARIAHMDAMGVDIQGLATFVSEYAYWAPADIAAESARLQNDHLAEACRDHPDRFAPFGATVPMQDVELAIAEMDRVVDQLGFKGLQIGGTIDGHNLDEPRFRPFWRAVAAKGIPVILHPNGYEESHRFGDYFMTNCIGNPLETMVAVHRMIFSGLFEELPDLKLVLLHGGGYLPFYCSRADHTWEVRPETRAYIPDHPPSYYMKNFFYDTMVFQPLYLRHLIDIVGSDRVMSGTDFPFDMGDGDPMGLIDRVEGLSDHERNALKGANAARIFNL